MDSQVQSPADKGGGFFGRFNKNVEYNKTQGDQLLWEKPTNGERGCGQDRGVGDEDRGDHGP